MCRSCLLKDFREKGISGFFWSFVENISTQAINFVIIIILARLLSPEYFGLFGISFLIVNVALVWIDTGFSYALIRKEKVDNNEYSSVFWANGFFGVFFFFCFYYFAPVTGLYFQEQRLPELIRISALMIPFSAFSSVHMIHLVRALDFKTQAKVTFWSTLAGGITSIILAYYGFGLVSLVWRFTIAYFIRMLLLWKTVKWSPKLVIKLSVLKSMIDFVFRIAVIYSFNSVLRSIYGIVIGKKYDIKTMGYYTTAESYSFIASTFLASTIQKVSFPLLSKFQNDIEMQRDLFRRILIVTMFITFISMLLLIVVAEPLILIMVGEKWYPSIKYFQLLCLFYMASPLQVLNQTLFSVNNKSNWFLKTEIFRILLSISVLIISSSYSIYCLLISIVIFSGWGGAFINAVYSRKMIGYSLLNQVKDILPSFFIAIVVAVLTNLVKYLFRLSPFWLLICQLSVAAALLIIICTRFRIKPYKELLNLLNNIRFRVSDGNS